MRRLHDLTIRPITDVPVGADLREVRTMHLREHVVDGQPAVRGCLVGDVQDVCESVCDSDDIVRLERALKLADFFAEQARPERGQIMCRDRWSGWTFESLQPEALSGELGIRVRAHHQVRSRFSLALRSAARSRSIPRTRPRSHTFQMTSYISAAT